MKASAVIGKDVFVLGVSEFPIRKTQSRIKLLAGKAYVDGTDSILDSLSLVLRVEGDERKGLVFRLPVDAVVSSRSRIDKGVFRSQSRITAIAKKRVIAKIQAQPDSLVEVAQDDLG